MLYEIVYHDRFVQAFKEWNRGRNFSKEALEQLFAYYDDCAEEVDINFNVIEICEEWSELSEQDFFSEYSYCIGIERPNRKPTKDEVDTLLEELDNHTLIFKLENGNYLIQGF